MTRSARRLRRRTRPYPRFDPPDPPRLGPSLLEPPLDALDVVRIEHQHEADPHVEHAVHLVGLDLAQLGDPVEDLGHRPAAGFDDRAASVGQHALEVVLESSAGDVSHSVHDFLDAVPLHHFPQCPGVDACRSQQQIGHGGLERFDAVIDTEPGGFEDRLADQAVAVGVEA